MSLISTLSNLSKIIKLNKLTKNAQSSSLISFNTALTKGATLLTNTLNQTSQERHPDSFVKRTVENAQNIYKKAKFIRLIMTAPYYIPILVLTPIIIILFVALYNILLKTPTAVTIKP